MKVIQSERPIFCDVDDTLVMHGDDLTLLCPLDIVEINDPISKRKIRLRKNHAMIRLVKEEFTRGAHIFVWSRGGFDWASSVVIALGLKPYVHYVLSKPLVYLDDKNVEQWLKDRVWISPNTKYKHTEEV